MIKVTLSVFSLYPSVILSFWEPLCWWNIHIYDVSFVNTQDLCDVEEHTYPGPCLGRQSPSRLIFFFF